MSCQYSNRSMTAATDMINSVGVYHGHIFDVEGIPRVTKYINGFKRNESAACKTSKQGL